MNAPVTILYRPVGPKELDLIAASGFRAFPSHEETVRQAKSPMIAARLGRSRAHPLRTDWETVKDEIMREALRAKFTQHPRLFSLLLATGDANLVEHTNNDSYWGDGGDGTGRNRLGELLMELRGQLHLEQQRR